jgi:cell division protein ZapA
MDNNSQIVSVRIYNQSYNIRASDGHAARMIRLAEMVDSRMNAIADEASTADSLKLAILAALHLADQLDQLKQRLDESTREVARKNDDLIELLEQVLDDKK